MFGQHNNQDHQFGLNLMHLKVRFNNVTGASYDRILKQGNFIGMALAVPAALMVSPAIGIAVLDTLLTMNLLVSAYTHVRDYFGKNAGAVRASEYTNALKNMRTAMEAEKNLQDKEKELLHDHLNEALNAHSLNVTNMKDSPVSKIKELHFAHFITNAITQAGIIFSMNMAGQQAAAGNPPAPTFALALVALYGISCFYNFNAAKARLAHTEHTLIPLEQAEKLIRQRGRGGPQ